MALLAPIDKYLAFDDSGNPLSGGLIFTYLTGTATPAATYTDSTGGTPNANPVVLNSRGEADIWLAAGTTYRFIVKTSAGTTIRTEDGIVGILTSASVQNGSLFLLSSVAGTNTITASAAFTPAAYANGMIYSFIPANTNTGAATINISSLGAKSITKQGTVALASGDLVATVEAFILYDGTEFQLLNPQAPVIAPLGSVAGTNTITASMTPALTAYGTTQSFVFTPANTNSGATTLNINSLGAKNVFSNGAACIGGELRQSVPTIVTYDGTQFNVIGQSAATQALADNSTKLANTAYADRAGSINTLVGSNNLIVQNNSGTPTTKMDITADEVLVKTSGNVAQIIYTFSKTIDMTVNGANGLDTGAKANSTWYFLFAIAKADGTQAGLASLSSTAPTMPSGYTYFRLLSANYIDGSGNFYRIYQYDRIVGLTVNQTIVDGAVTSATWTSISLAAFAPSTAKRVIIAAGNASNNTAISPRSDGYDGSYFAVAPSGTTATFGVFPTTRVLWVMHKIRYAASIYYWIQGTTGSLIMCGWEY